MSTEEATARAWATLADAMRNKPEAWQAIAREFSERHLALWQSTIGRASDGATGAGTTQQPAAADLPPTFEPAALAGPAPDPELDAMAARDRRFNTPAWLGHAWFDYLRRTCLLNESWLERMITAAQLDPETERRTRFFLRQWLDAMSPANFAATNPEVLALAAQSGGESLARGMQRLAEDTRRGALTMTDESAFEVGRNLALTPGAVIHRNEIMEVIHYQCLTAKVHARPLVIIPPFINKYYVLDLQPGNSFVRFALEQGFNVFIVSWRNVPAALGHLRWDDYAERGVLAAIGIACEVTGSEKVNTLGFCVGGTLLSTALALAAARGQHRVASTTLLATMLDFSDVGEIGVYVDPQAVEACERRFAPGIAPGVMSGRDLALTFASLRANDLIWRFVVDHWLKGKTPEPFDLLYWNSDGTNLPGALYAWYLRQMYLENNLREPGRVRLAATPIDLRGIRCAWYLLAAEEDHIVPWRTAWLARALLRGTREFVLAASGHIAGVVNPASRNRRHYFTAAAAAADAPVAPGSGGRVRSDRKAVSAQAWRDRADRNEGSWWTHWSAWQRRRAGPRVKAPAQPGSGTHRPLEAAPGRYVRER